MTRLLLSVLLALTAACDTPPEDDGDAAPLDAGQIDGGDRGPDSAPPVDASPSDAAPPDADGAPPDANAPPPDAAPPALDAAPPVVDAGPPPGPRIGGLWDAHRTPWPMFGLDPQRTGRSPFLGPRTLTAGAAGNWRVRAEGQAVINLQPAVDAVGVYFGGWGVQRLADGAPLTDRIKSDGRYFGLDAASGEALFEPFDPAPVHGCYVHPGRAQVPRDATWCGEGEHVVSFYNGTIEATPLIDPDNGRHYVGRGDGRLYAIDPATGAVLWTFVTFNPEDPDDPDGGGEIVGGAVMGPDRLIYFATAGLPVADPPLNPRYETNAVYAIDRRGHLVWRYPGRRASLERGFLAAPALDPAGETVYFGTGLRGRPRRAARLRSSGGMARRAYPDRPDNPARAGTPAWVRHLTVGGDGTSTSAPPRPAA
ncbi:MAG: PQQ-binding-like beta-propeller repeat protein [bacterium]